MLKPVKTAKHKFKRWLIPALLSVTSLTATALNPEEQRWVEAVTLTYGERAGKRVETWRSKLSHLSDEAEKIKLREVNKFFNQLYFVNDIDLWGKNDYWATPLEFLGANAGDCEDFTIAKYFSLLELGVSDTKLRLVYVKALELNQFHMVLAYYEKPSSVPVILDNINPVIKPATQRRDLLPIYSFNGKNLWLMKEKASGTLAGKSSRLSLWNELRSRRDAVKLNKPIRNYGE
ncbi:transglutaminase-like cysteine peptidase [Vibrio hannami]|uniref:transglutaminase-like cysteine peptidase n=1 Tax=Vibrio hannami TaxID=2717094 RepID=UPI0024105DF5|nr:transglutaminase-like cysteine peptidase [Vibrio hannami]MDG3086288.1 transglutaminase-like cysteine peptidase [Vibrio hannami]